MRLTSLFLCALLIAVHPAHAVIMVGFGQSSGGGETIGTSTQGASQLAANDGNYIYAWPIDGTLTSNGDLESFTVTLRAQTGAREIRLGLYTGDATTPISYVSGSDTGWITYTAAADKTNVTFTPTGTASLSSGQQYWIAYRVSGFTSVYGTTSTGTTGKKASLLYANSFASDWSTYSGKVDSIQALPGKWQITTN